MSPERTPGKCNGFVSEEEMKRFVDYHSGATEKYNDDNPDEALNNYDNVEPEVNSDQEENDDQDDLPFYRDLI